MTTYSSERPPLSPSKALTVFGWLSPAARTSKWVVAGMIILLSHYCENAYTTGKDQIIHHMINEFAIFFAGHRPAYANNGVTALCGEGRQFGLQLE